MNEADKAKPILRFGDCKLTKLERTFGLQQIEGGIILQNWLDKTAEISGFEQQSLEFYRSVLRQNSYDWNEMELLQGFIGPMFTLVNFTTKKFNLFSERAISAVVAGIELRGDPDGMIASGMREPEMPYFCFQEYKKFKNPEGDPAGQCLAAMLVAQTLHQNDQPIYGCFVMGYSWHFMVLQGREYAISQVYAATRDDVFDIFRILRGLKQIITELVS